MKDKQGELSTFSFLQGPIKVDAKAEFVRHIDVAQCKGCEQIFVSAFGA